MADNYDDVKTFHFAMGLPLPDAPQLLDRETRKFRERFMHEELDEFHGACAAYDLPGAADALVDLVYVAMGTAVMMGLPWQELWDEVQRANMAKQRALPDGSDSKRGSALDVVKPMGWQPPDIAGVLRRYGADT